MFRKKNPFPVLEYREDLITDPRPRRHHVRSCPPVDTVESTHRANPEYAVFILIDRSNEWVDQTPTLVGEVLKRQGLLGEEVRLGGLEAGPDISLMILIQKNQVVGFQAFSIYRIVVIANDFIVSSIELQEAGRGTQSHGAIVGFNYFGNDGFEWYPFQGVVDGMTFQLIGLQIPTRERAR